MFYSPILSQIVDLVRVEPDRTGVLLHRACSLGSSTINFTINILAQKESIMTSWNERTHSIVDYTEKPGMNPKALIIGCLLSIPLWAIIIGGIWLIVTIINHIF